MAKIDPKPRTNSIAGRIHRSYLFRIIGFFLIFDVLVIALVAALFLGSIEWAYLEDYWNWDLERGFVYELPKELENEHWSKQPFKGVYYVFGPRKEFFQEQVEASQEQVEATNEDKASQTQPLMPSNADNADVDSSLRVTDTNNSQDLANSLGASETWDNEGNISPYPPLAAGYRVDLEEPLRIASIGFSVILTIEIIFLISLAWNGRKRVLTSLRPLQQLAEMAEELSEVSIQEVALDSERYHELEHAIAEFSPSSPDDRLTTGDKELMGLETAINNLLGKMHESYQQQNRFVSDASHELKTPIAVIQGYADLLARWGSKDEAVLQESIQAIQDEAKQMQLLVEQLLFLARGDTGRQSLTFETLDLSELLREVADEFSMIDDAHEWIVDANEVVELQGDRSMLKQVMRILCDNAKKYSPAGTKIQLSTYVEGKHAIFAIQDAGQGIPQEELPMIFDRFYRADPARGKQTGGTGLGLSIADWIVTQHGGYFRVLSREGLGTRFRIFLPLHARTVQAGAQPRA